MSSEEKPRCQQVERAIRGREGDEEKGGNSRVDMKMIGRHFSARRGMTGGKQERDGALEQKQIPIKGNDE